MIGLHVRKSESSSWRGPVSILAVMLCVERNINMDPSFCWNGGCIFNCGNANP
jgi:hypothetical protein